MYCACVFAPACVHAREYMRVTRIYITIVAFRGGYASYPAKRISMYKA